MRSDVLNQNSGKYGRTPDVYKMSAQTADFTAVDAGITLTALGAEPNELLFLFV